MRIRDLISVPKPFNVLNPCDLGLHIITRDLKNVKTPGHLKYWHKDTQNPAPRHIKTHNKTHKTHKNYEFRAFFASYSWDLWDTDTSQTAHWTYESRRHRARFIGWEEREYNQFPRTLKNIRFHRDSLILIEHSQTPLYALTAHL